MQAEGRLRRAAADVVSHFSTGPADGLGGHSQNLGDAVGHVVRQFLQPNRQVGIRPVRSGDGPVEAHGDFTPSGAIHPASPPAANTL